MDNEKLEAFKHSVAKFTKEAKTLTVIDILKRHEALAIEHYELPDDKLVRMMAKGYMDYATKQMQDAILEVGLKKFR